MITWLIRFALLRVVVWSLLVAAVFVRPELQTSVAFLVAISLLAGWEGAFSNYQAGRAEREARSG